MSSTNGYASRDSFWAFHGREYKDVECPALGKVRIQSLSDAEQRKLSMSGRDEFGRLTDAGYLFADRAIAQVVDPEDSQPMFGTIDRENLATMRFSVTRFLYEAMVDFSAGTQPEEDEEEDLKKTYETTAEATSSTS